MARFVFIEFESDDPKAAMVALAQVLHGGQQLSDDERKVVTETERVVGFAPNPPEVDEEEEEPDEPESV